MRLTTWNCCRSSVAASLQLLAPLNPTVVLLQECRGPNGPVAGGTWQHTAKQLGVATVGIGGTAMTPQQIEELPSSALVTIRDGPTPFALLNVWAQLPRYEEDVLNGVRATRSVILADLPLVVAGDFNSSRAVSSQRRRSPEMFRVLTKEFGLVSAYHHYFGVEPGCELHPTLYLNRQQDRPFHIDYCFVPESWTDKVKAVEVGSYSEWTGSDHRPLTVDLGV